MTRDLKNRFESFFLLSPLLVVMVGAFVFSGAKSLVSYLVFFVSVYCLVFYREEYKSNIKNIRLRCFLFLSVLAFFYFGFFHFFRGDNFGFSRTLITCVVYVCVVPWRKIEPSMVRFVFIFAGMVCGSNAIYEYFILGVSRVGVITNPIPYALYSSLLSLMLLYYLLTDVSIKYRLLSGFSFCFSIISLLLTESRGVIVFFPVVAFYLFYRVFFSSSRSGFKIIMVVSFLLIGSMFLFHDKLENRYDRTMVELSLIRSGNLETSIGARLESWKLGYSLFRQVPLYGVGDKVLLNEISKVPNQIVSTLNHLHNQAIDTLARYGLLGAITLFFWMFSPLFYRKTKQKLSINATPLMSSIILMFIFAGLSDVPLHHTHLVYLFAIVSGAILAKNLDCVDSV